MVSITGDLLLLQATTANASSSTTVHTMVVIVVAMISIAMRGFITNTNAMMTVDIATIAISEHAVISILYKI